MKKNDQITCTRFLDKYLGLFLNDIDDKGIHFVKGDEYALIGNPDHLDGTSTDHEYFFIRDDLFERILEIDQNYDITLKVNHKEPSFSSINFNISDSRSEKNSRSETVSPHHQLHRKRQKKIS